LEPCAKPLLRHCYREIRKPGGNTTRPGCPATSRNGRKLTGIFGGMYVSPRYLSRAEWSLSNDRVPIFLPWSGGGVGCPETGDSFPPEVRVGGSPHGVIRCARRPNAKGGRGIYHPLNEKERHPSDWTPILPGSVGRYISPAKESHRVPMVGYHTAGTPGPR
jgi:hypothetical protein